jgi:hypothetical protein
MYQLVPEHHVSYLKFGFYSHGQVSFWSLDVVVRQGARRSCYPIISFDPRVEGCGIIPSIVLISCSFADTLRGMFCLELLQSRRLVNQLLEFVVCRWWYLLKNYALRC